MSISSATPYTSLSDALLARHKLAAHYKRMPKAPTDENEAQNLIDWFQGFIVRMDTVIQEVRADKVGVDFNNICENVRAFVEPLATPAWYVWGTTFLPDLKTRFGEQALRDAVDLAFTNADIEEHHFISLKDLLDEQEKLPATKANICSSDEESKIEKDLSMSTQPIFLLPPTPITIRTAWKQKRPIPFSEDHVP
ncbi:uncharacterized protein LAESUDRAFT_715819 [Laetiporus sulphureus 93-53]|uniref:Uncharacterized protein n=1 Tax=Laetiporus sulphureus 93-53 TaxID=1314785 RepID=A0A165D404_9APHY|nr:uncharacterized protein LAESUDRAFT_715819 [Laetiporus sulphureus 93-53]KZT04110.1 hypothetical protein LAESUDRAFT_715819 [Laetiporus sulphureus 93-53]